MIGCGRDIFSLVDRACSCAEEPIAVYCTKDDSERIERMGSVRATVIIGSSASESAGAIGHPESAAAISVDIRCREWWAAFNFEPRFGMQFEHQRLGRIVVKNVQKGEFSFVCRCTQSMRSRER